MVTEERFFVACFLMKDRLLAMVSLFVFGCQGMSSRPGLQAFVCRDCGRYGDHQILRLFEFVVHEEVGMSLQV